MRARECNSTLIYGRMQLNPHIWNNDNSGQGQWHWNDNDNEECCEGHYQ